MYRYMQLIQRKKSLNFFNCYHANIRFFGKKDSFFIQTFLNIYSNFVIDIDILRPKCFGGTNLAITTQGPLQTKYNIRLSENEIWSN